MALFFFRQTIALMIICTAHPCTADGASERRCSSWPGALVAGLSNAELRTCTHTACCGRDDATCGPCRHISRGRTIEDERHRVNRRDGCVRLRRPIDLQYGRDRIHLLSTIRRRAPRAARDTERNQCTYGCSTCEIEVCYSILVCVSA